MDNETQPVTGMYLLQVGYLRIMPAHLVAYVHGITDGFLMTYYVTIVLLLFGLNVPVNAVDQPTLARLSFWAPPAQVSKLAKFCTDQMVPLLEARGLKRSTRTFEPASDSLFCLLFESAAPDSFYAIKETLTADPIWQKRLHTLADKIGVEADSLRYRFRIFETPAGAGTTVATGPGFHQGLWHGFSAGDGLPTSDVYSILQDRDGYLWFGGDALSRFDGQTFKYFTAADGFPHESVLAIVEDRDGNLWLGTGDHFSRRGSGVVRYDRHSFRIFTSEDGLVDNQTFSIAEDGIQALDKLTAGAFDLAFLDNRMPGLTGLEALIQFRRDNPDMALKIIALSASVLDHQRQEFLDAGLAAHLRQLRQQHEMEAISQILETEASA